MLPISNLVRTRRELRAVVLGATLLSAPLTTFAAEVNLPPVSVGAGVRTYFSNVDADGAPEDVNDFELGSARIYISGKATDNISIMFNTEYNPDSDGDRSVEVIDAAVQVAFSDQFNIWAGRFLPPSDRANLYGPYYASNWGVFRDGVQDGYLFETTGRDDGVMYWGQFGKAKLSFGVFDVPLTKGDSDVLYAGRAQFDFWDAENGYYLNGSYYGDKDLLAVGVAAQKVGSSLGMTADFLMEKKLGNSGVVTVEAQYADYEAPQGYVGGEPADSDGFYVLGAYMLPQVIGIGQIQFLGKYGESTYEFITGDEDLETLELNVNYIIKGQNARVSLFYIDQDLEGDGRTEIGLGLQVQI